MSMSAAGDLGRQVRNLYLVAMALFAVTIVIGIVNGLDLYEFDRNQLLTHVHSGTVGWLSLGIIASALWMRGSANRTLALGFAILIPAYVLAFYTGNLPARATTGVALLVAMAWLFVWAWRWAMSERSLPALAVTLGITSFFYGGVIGVLFQVQLATGITLFPEGADIVGAHAGTMTFAYLILAAMGFLEWRVRGDHRDADPWSRPDRSPLRGRRTARRRLDLRARPGPGDRWHLPPGGVGRRRALRDPDPALGGPHRLAVGHGSPIRCGGFDLRGRCDGSVHVPGHVLPRRPRPSPSRPSSRSWSATDHAAYIGVTTNVLLGLMFGLAADRADGRGVVTQAAFWVVRSRAHHVPRGARNGDIDLEAGRRTVDRVLPSWCCSRSP